MKTTSVQTEKHCEKEREKDNSEHSKIIAQNRAFINFYDAFSWSTRNLCNLNINNYNEFICMLGTLCKQNSSTIKNFC